jgi:ABC-2 type transport system permease protein
MIAAILRAQLLSMRLRTGTRRGSTIFSAFTGLVFYGFWAFLAWAAMLYFSLPDQAPFFVPVLSSGLLAVMLYWQLAPIISASFGASLDLRKLLVYPIPHGTLFQAEILLRITTCAEMVIMVSGGAIGLMRNPTYAARAAPHIVIGALTFVAMNILLSAGARNWLERFFLRTRLREVMVLVLVFAGFLPQFLVFMHVNISGLMRFAPSQVVWPWAAMGRLMLGDRLALCGATSAAWLTASWWFSRRQFERTIRYDATALKRPGRYSERQPRTRGFSERLFRFPSRFLPDPIAAIMEKELRTFARIPRFRLVYAMSCFFGIVLYFPSLRRGQHNSFFQQNALLIMSLYGLLMLGQISYWNSFGFDRSAVQGYFSWPIRLRDVLLAKNLTVVCLLIPQILVIALIGRAAHLPGGPAKVLETVVVMIVAALYWLSMGNICSVRMPRALDPEKMNQMSNKMQALTIWTAPFLLLPLFLAYWSRWFFESELLFAVLLLVAAIVGGIFYWVGLDSAVNTAIEKRESMLSQLSRSEGPLSAT